MKKSRRRKARGLKVEDAQSWGQILLHGSSIEDKKDVSDESIKRRIILFSSAMIVLLAVLAIKLFSIQVIASNQYIELANGNRIREEITYAPRGKIYDRDGRILADNTIQFQLNATPYLLDKDKKVLEENIKYISKVSGVTNEEISKMLNDVGLDYVLPVPIVQNLSQEQAIKIESVKKSVKGFSLDQIPTRKYDSRGSISHIIGYVGRVSEDDLNNDKSGLLLPTDQIGKVGIEYSLDEKLRGENGWVRYEVDALGRPVRIIDKRDPVPGEDIDLSIDLEVQISMSNSVQAQMTKANSQRGSGVTVDPVTGEILAMVSLPAYDNNLFINGISEADYSKLSNNPNQPLYNKAIAGGYTSGSIIKPLVASAALQEGVVNESTIIVDGGYIDVVGEYGGSFRFRGWLESGLGPMNARSALAWSSNIYFYTVGGGHGGIKGLGEERLTKYYGLFGLGRKTGVELPGEVEGRVPDEEWKLANKGEPWYVGDSYNISIGQGDLLITPLQITMSESAIANGGFLLKPTLIKGSERQVIHELPINKYYLEVVRQGMRQVLTGGTTCECVFKDVGQAVAGKSGTAETNTPDGRPPHAWFTAFAPYAENSTNPEILSTVLIEEGVGGSQYAAPAIAETFKTYFAN